MRTINGSLSAVEEICVRDRQAVSGWLDRINQVMTAIQLGNQLGNGAVREIGEMANQQEQVDGITEKLKPGDSSILAKAISKT